MSRRVATATAALGVGLLTSGGWCFCFPPTVRIALPGRRRLPIADLTVGARLRSFDAAACRPVARPVSAVLLGPRRALVRLDHGGPDGPLLATADHPVYLPDDDAWAPAGTVRPGQRLLVLDARDRAAPRRVLDARPAPAPPTSVRTLSVGGPEHTFFADGVLVHNKPPPDDDDDWYDYDDDDATDDEWDPDGEVDCRDAAPVSCAVVDDFLQVSDGRWSGFRGGTTDTGFVVAFQLDLCALGEEEFGVDGGVANYGIGDAVVVDGAGLSSLAATSSSLRVTTLAQPGADTVIVSFPLLCPGVPDLLVGLRMTGLGGDEGAAQDLPVEVFAPDP